jgi:hypothetical protein
MGKSLAFMKANTPVDSVVKSRSLDLLSLDQLRLLLSLSPSLFVVACLKVWSPPGKIASMQPEASFPVR